MAAVAELGSIGLHPPAMAKSILCRLAFLVSPKPELFASLQIDSKAEHPLCDPVTIITPRLDYEGAFEGWKRLWRAKAKEDYISEVIDLWSEHFPEIINQLRKEAASESFDQWWTISELDVIEIDDAWRPS
jgi:hypothetical protein